MLTLNATLQTAQDGISHRPIVELTSSPMGSIVPVAGNYFNTLTTDEYEPQIISLSIGRLAVTFQRGNNIYYLYTPTDRSEWIEVLVKDRSTETLSDPCICELSNGNIGVIYVSNQTSLYYSIITPTGEVVTDYILIESGIAWVGNPYVITLANDSYLLVYPEGTGIPPDTSKTYYLKQRTSSNFTSWGAATDITPAAFVSTNYCNNPHLIQITSGRIFLHVDYMNDYVNLVELNNIYHMTSDDNGSSWSMATKVTNYTAIGLSATHPTAAEKQTGDITFMYSERSVVKMLDINMTGYPSDNFELMRGPTLDIDTNEIHFAVRDGGYGGSWAVVTINTELWEYDSMINWYSIPPVANGVIADKFESDCEWSAWSISGVGHNLVQAYDHPSEVLKNYQWGLSPGTNFGEPVSFILPISCGYASIGLAECLIVEDGGIQKLYLMYWCWGYGSTDMSFGWIDLNEIADPITGLYTYNEVYGSYINMQMFSNMRWDEAHSYIICYQAGTTYNVPNPGIWIYDPAAQATILTVAGVSGRAFYDPNFTHEGARSVIYVDEDIYFTFPYYSGQPDKRGLGRMDGVTGNITYYEPTWATVNDYQLFDLKDMGDGRLLMYSNNTLANGGGVAIYDTIGGGWTIINDDTYPGFGRTSANWNWVDYDPVTKTIYAQYGNTIIAFSEYGPYSILQQTDIENIDSTIDYGSYTDFSYEFFEYQSNIVYDADHVLWIVWNHLEAGSEYSAKWANLIGDFDITNDITSAPIAIEWDVEKPTKLSFTLSRGHLYDPQNLLSTLSPFFRRGRKIVIALGERVGSSDYLQNQGEFAVKTVVLAYTTGKYPSIKITAEDLRTLWEDHEVIATQYYDDATPHNTLEHILLHYASMEAGEMNLPPTFVNTHLLHHQFVNMNLDDIVKELLDHFGYFPFINVDGKFEPRHVNLSKATDHVYSNVIQMVQYTPNDSYSTFINRIIVKGISHVYTEVLYEEESVTSLTGTTGWWGKKTDEKAWYSDDHNRTCRYPRLEIVQSVTEFKIFGIKSNNASEALTGLDPDEHYVIVTIEAPNYMHILFATIGALVAAGIWCANCDGYVYSYCGWCIFTITTILNVLLMILGAVASYNYNIWARPIGHEKKTFQATSDDEQLQSELGTKIVTTTIDDPMCYTISSCQVVADQEMEIVMAQRRRLKFKKSAHLQDEIGDIIQMTHPYSGEALKIFVSKIKRTMIVGKDFKDEIQGWRLLS